MNKTGNQNDVLKQLILHDETEDEENDAINIDSSHDKTSSKRIKIFSKILLFLSNKSTP